MKEKTLLKIALICSVVGIAILYAVSLNISINEKTIDEINKGDIGEKVKIKGVLTKVSDTENVVFLEITQAQNMDVIIFKDKGQILNLTEGNYVEIIGKIEEYEGKREVIADRVRVVE
ncbi:hypothetical protein J4209_02335 [Candidatus Woesearchaeota archaeon]|nr:hypothetical protein [Candidatus Woesearchaeota archaeon]